MPTAEAATQQPPPSAGFFSELPLLASGHDAFDENRYRPAPDDWALVVTDVVDSTGAIARGRHKTVNFVAAMGIAGLRNLCAPTRIPFLFGGDGGVVLVPPANIAQARIGLARARGQALRDFGLALRVGLATVEDLRRYGCEVSVGRFEPTPGNSFGVFLGGGVGVLETAVRGGGDAELARLAAIPESLDDGEPVNLEGLSCRWDTLHSTRGTMLTVIVRGTSGLREVYAEIMRLAGPEAQARPVSLDTLRARWPPKGFMLEARARRRGGSLVAWTARVLAETLLARIVLARGKPIGDFDPDRYRSEIVTNTDFCKHDETLCFVIDCPLAAVDKIESYLAGMAATQGLRHGTHVSDTALMTCLVVSPPDSLHVHFVDGGGGGYTSASRRLKASGHS